MMRGNSETFLFDCKALQVFIIILKMAYMAFLPGLIKFYKPVFPKGLGMHSL